jgi:RNA polymerase I-specific transcription initiation factor RRN3
MEGPIMSLFVDKALDMDVEIKIDDNGGVCLDTNGKGDGVANEEYVPAAAVKQEMVTDNATSITPVHSPALLTKKRSFQQLSCSEGSTSNDAIIDLTKDNSDHISEIAERLDSLMTLLCQRIIQLTTFSKDSLSEAITAVINARRLYRYLDEVFDKKVRTTDRSKFVQFVFLVLFGRENDALEAVGRLMAKRDGVNGDGSINIAESMKDINMDSTLVSNAPINITDPLYRGWCAQLIDLFYSPDYAGEHPRQTVCCYLASFVSRATYVCPETVCECVAAILRWAEVYISTHSGVVNTGSSTPGPRRKSSSGIGNTQHPCEVHALFFTACQAAFYIMCFRGVEAIEYWRNACEHKDDPESPYADPESVDIGAERWRSICGHELQPLKYCLESVRVEFLHLAGELDLFADASDSGDDGHSFVKDLWSSITSQSKTPTKTKSSKSSRRKSKIISTAATQEKKRLDGGVGGLGKGSNPLDSFFPFDPYLLQSSYSHVHPYYRNWEDCITCDYLAEDVADNEEEEEDVSDSSDDDEQDEPVDESDVSEDEKSVAVRYKEQERGHFENELRRSRAMSTGSQCSW